MASAARPDASGIAQRFRGSVRRDVSSEPRVEPRAATAGVVHAQQSGLALLLLVRRESLALRRETLALVLAHNILTTVG
jgi:hypothetical protein